MLNTLAHDILPVFAMLALGFLMGRVGTASQGEAKALNRIAFLVLQPPLIFMLLSSLDLGSVRWDAIALYALCEAVAFAASFALARYVFRSPPAEAWLLGMAVTFVNSLLYVWPIATLLYGEAGALPVTAIVALDASVWFAFFIIGAELLAGDKGAAVAASRLLRHPVLVTIVVAVLWNLSGVPVPEPLLVAARFAGAGAAPLTLFALGVVLSAERIVPTGAVAAIAGMKLIAFPLLVFAAFAVFSPGNDWERLFVLNAAGPSGAMAFALALLHGVPTRSIAPVIIWTSVLSLVSLAWLA